ncbi:MAG: hypothetical protein A3C93_02085 [Candidatus Lloydbacteria bacterium RIFCSPHIGHO2_02_FULL_54_17]|uniref:Uncharacterized protein n=1 Tax=Candidatus Lloydbacteria bacterium RIFCSPHIGHO2_02_FULL_54_17 TaxID=1798664 RepID=A0A1G2DJX0_9BACT|nr:MAG: hypothetical protein A2762_05635 [Candidatus Lloydbacteria bacterium RIFCSPHIGHO2_01_FULL_54_11]OGZ13241.1 MAG: hypothetical protein A3C93_02085 [Candidatus Lloydbacteria bacterium RIFCSPHIGHO2_02_FULL_54_17]OGZ15371.1 MAG: hypothetical protein A2948_00100 [Candidatus Lloydbacteria bacterium RIFCSPLOWO2_01_FULL_54_18]
MKFFQKTVTYGTIAFVVVSAISFLLLSTTIGNEVFIGLFIGGNMGTGMFYVPNPNDPPSQLLALTMGTLAEYKEAPWAPGAEEALGWVGMVLGTAVVASFFAVLYMLYVGILRSFFYGTMTTNAWHNYVPRTFMYGFILSASTLAFGWMNFDAALWKSPDPTLELIPLVTFAIILWRQHVLNKRVSVLPA